MAERKLIAIRIDPNLCVGAGMCVSAHPDKFVLQPDGHAACVGDVPDEAVAREVEELCPVTAISLVFEGEEGR